MCHVAMAEEMVAVKDKYVEKNWQTLLDALDAAKAVRDNGDALDEDVKEASQALLDAIIMQRFKANKDNLQEVINKANALDLDQYTDESVQLFLAALKEANAVMDNAELSEDDQAVVDNAEAKLSDAIEGLALKDGSTTDDGNADSPDTGDYSPLFGITIALAAIAGGALLLRRRLYNK